MADDPTPLDRFIVNIRSFTELLMTVSEEAMERKQPYVEPVLIDLGGRFLEEIDGPRKEKIIEGFIKLSYHSWERIRSKDHTFFEDCTDEILAMLPNSLSKNQLPVFRKFLNNRDEKGNYTIGENRITEIMDFVISFVRISISHIHEKREPSQGPDGKPYYKKGYMNHVDLRAVCEKWNIRLRF